MNRYFKYGILLLFLATAIIKFFKFHFWELKFNLIYVNALFRFSIGLILIWVSKKLIIEFLKKRIDSNNSKNFIVGMDQIYGIIITLFLISVLFQFLGIKFAEMITSISIFAAAIALISKDYIANMINGMILIFSSFVSIDDQIKVAEHRGKIIDINLMNTQLLTDDDDIVFIPNTIMLSSTTINYSKREIKKSSVEFEMPLKSVQNIELLENEFIASLDAFKHLIHSNSFRLKIVNLDKDKASFKFQYILKESNKVIDREIKRCLFSHCLKLIHN